MAGKTIKINRAPVLALWATVVAERSGYDHEAALTLGKAVAGLNAQSKGRRLGIYEESKDQKEEGERGDRRPPETDQVTILGRAVPVEQTKQGIRAVSGDKPISAASVQRYLNQKFGDNLTEVQSAMAELAASFEPDQLASKAYSLYEQFRPEIPEGQKGWGAAGELDLDLIRSLAQ